MNGKGIAFFVFVFFLMTLFFNHNVSETLYAPPTRGLTLAKTTTKTRPTKKREKIVEPEKKLIAGSMQGDTDGSFEFPNAQTTFELDTSSTLGRAETVLAPAPTALAPTAPAPTAPKKKKKYSLPWMTKAETAAVLGSINKTTRYVEWGAGGSTSTFAVRAAEADSIEHNLKWCKEVQKRVVELQADNVKVHCKSVEKGYLGWGGGLEEGTFAQFEEYVDAAHNIGLLPDSVDVVLDDGRARVPVALSVFPYLKPHTGVLFMHDYTHRDRSYYHVVEQFYDKLETVNTLAKFRRKPGVAPPTREEIFALSKIPKQKKRFPFV